jgi:hypothetical protein
LKSSVVCFIIVCVMSAFPLGAKDFGLVLDQRFSLGGIEEETQPAYTGTVLPWFSALGETGWDIHVSAGLTFKYEQEETFFIPELFRTQVRYRRGPQVIQAGRIRYADPLGLVAAGLFDGVSYSLDRGGAAFSAGAWYTGFLYKKSANITASAEDAIAYDAKFELEQFGDTYLASRRLLAALGFEHPSLAGMLELQLSLAAQVDLNGRDELLHSQYLTAKLSAPVRACVFTLGGSFETIQDGGELKLALLGRPGISWALPTAIHDRLSLSAWFSSGASGGLLAAFVPLTAIPQGNILKAAITGLSALHTEYTARPHQTLSVTGKFFYFVRSDQGSYRLWPAAGDGYFLGGELYARALWSPVSDLTLNCGGGVFLPQLGNAGPAEKARWKIEIGAVFALY